MLKTVVLLNILVKTDMFSGFFDEYEVQNLGRNLLSSSFSMEVSGYQQLFSYSLENVFFCNQHKEEIHTGLKYNMKVNKWWKYLGELSHEMHGSSVDGSEIELYQCIGMRQWAAFDKTDSDSCKKSYLLLRNLLPAALTAELRNAVDNQD